MRRNKTEIFKTLPEADQVWNNKKTGETAIILDTDFRYVWYERFATGRKTRKEILPFAREWSLCQQQE